jgi:zinc transporter 1
MYTYGWQRAETLGALINGVFLVALCLSIFLEAIQRFVEPQEVSHPKLVLIVGCFGLASNIIGLFLFHEHGHSHGGPGHSHGHESTDGLREAEEGHSHAHAHDTDTESQAIADESGNIVDVLPENRIGHIHSAITRKSSKARSTEISWNVSSGSTEGVSTKATPVKRHRKRHSRSRSRGYSGLEDIYVHPASFRNEIIAASRLEDVESGTDTEIEQAVVDDTDATSTETSPLLQKSRSKGSDSDRLESAKKRDWHHDHKHNQPQEPSKKGGHSHGDLNMRGVFLHVMGDALGNVGVIASALIIWLTNFSWRFYSDPLISLIITVIILCSAIPLCKAASRILLQAVPAGISVDDIKDDISELPGIVSCHHLHVWQLSDTKMVASLHVQVGIDFKGEGSAKYMELARAIRKCLHEYGIHSSTIQPEFCLDANHDHSSGPDDSSCDGDHADSGSSTPIKGKKNGSVRDEAEACLLECGDDCANGTQCCAPATQGCGSAK